MGAEDGDGPGNGSGVSAEDEGMGHPGMSDASAANTSGMAGPAGAGDDTGISANADTPVSFDFAPHTMGTIGFGHPGLSDAAAIGTAGMAGPASSKSFGEEGFAGLMSRLPGTINAKAAAMPGGFNPDAPAPMSREDRAMAAVSDQNPLSSAASLGLLGPEAMPNSAQSLALLSQAPSIQPGAQEAALGLLAQPVEYNYQPYAPAIQPYWAGNRFINPTV